MNTDNTELEDAAIYLRYSANTDNKIPAIEDQLARITEHVVPGRYNVVTVLKDPGVSAWSGSNKPRAEWEALKRLVAERKVSAVLFDRQDRLSRDDAETWEFMALCKRNRVRWHAADGKVLDFNNRADAMRAFWEGGDANAYSDLISANTRRKYATERAKGLPYGKGPRPFGRMADHLAVNEDEAALICIGRDMLLNEGKSLYAVMLAWQAAGSKTPQQGGEWSSSSVRHTMRKWSNAAVPSYQDEPLEGVTAHESWQPIISRSDVEQIRALIALKPSTGTGVTTLCGGIIRCRCGAPMIGGGWQGRNSGRRIYRCSYYTDNKVNTTNTKGQHSTVARHLADAAARKAVVDSYFLTPQLTGAATGEAAQLTTLHNELSDVRVQIERLLDLYLGSKISEVIFTKQNDALSVRESELTSKIAQCAAASANARMLTETRRLLFSGRTINLGDAVAAKRELGEVFDSLELEDQRALLRSTAHVIVGPGAGAGRFAVTGNALPTDADELETQID